MSSIEVSLLMGQQSEQLGAAAGRLEAVNTFLVNFFNDVFEQLTSGITNPTDGLSEWNVVPVSSSVGSLLNLQEWVPSIAQESTRHVRNLVVVVFVCDNLDAEIPRRWTANLDQP